MCSWPLVMMKNNRFWTFMNRNQILMCHIAINIKYIKAWLNVYTRLWRTEMMLSLLCIFWNIQQNIKNVVLRSVPLIIEAFFCHLTTCRTYRKTNQQMNQLWHNDSRLPCFKSILNHTLTWSRLSVLLEQDYAKPHSHSGDKRPDEGKGNFKDIKKCTHAKVHSLYCYSCCLPIRCV